jgi:xanthine dehydrogenase iron-sulfur cluster and FAD-binding subunit A
MWKQYYTVTKIDQALNLLSDTNMASKIIAGGTDLILEMRQGLHGNVETLIDISRLSNLANIFEDERGFIHLGASVTHAQCVASKVLIQKAFPLVQACYGIGSPQIRNIGTVAGNLITASPANDTISALLALDAELVLKSTANERVVKISEFYNGVRKTVIKPNEMLVEIRFKGLGNNQKGFFNRYLLRQTHAISLVNVTIVLSLDKKIITNAIVVLGAVAPTVFRSIKAEKFLIGKELNEETIRESAKLAETSSAPITDIRASDKYRYRLVNLLVQDGLWKIQKGEEKSNFPSVPVLLWGNNKLNNQRTTDNQFISDRSSIIQTRINGKDYSFNSGQNDLLVNLIRDKANLVGTKIGCGEGECGACTIFLDGLPVFSCLIPAPRAQDREIITIEGISQNNELHPVQESFIEKGAIQCGYCTPGFIMSAVKLLEEIPHPSRQQIKDGLEGNLCRCTGYFRIIEAIEQAAEMIKGGKA